MTLSDFILIAKYSLTWSIVRSSCDSWVSCYCYCLWNVWGCMWIVYIYFCCILSGTENTHRKMLRSVSCSKQFLLLETLSRVDSGNCRPLMIPLSRSSELLCCTFLRMPGSRAIHTTFCQGQLKQKERERHNALVEAKDKPFSELTFGEKGENVILKPFVKIHIFYIFYSKNCKYMWNSLPDAVVNSSTINQI